MFCYGPAISQISSNPEEKSESHSVLVPEMTEYPAKRQMGLFVVIGYLYGAASGSSYVNPWMRFSLLPGLGKW